MPAFWDGDRWRVRFAPTRLGAYALSVRRNGRPVAPAGPAPRRLPLRPLRLVRLRPARPGDVQRFVFDNGRDVLPARHGRRLDRTGRCPDYPAARSPQMHGAGMNWARVWMNYWDGKSLEWSPDQSQEPEAGLLLLDAARRWDAIMDAADKNGVFVQMTLQHHGPYTERTDPNWRDNPFNAANGGFLQASRRLLHRSRGAAADPEQVPLHRRPLGLLDRTCWRMSCSTRCRTSPRPRATSPTSSTGTKRWRPTIRAAGHQPPSGHDQQLAPG